MTTAESPTPQPARTVSVVGHGGADTAPDVLRIELGVECSATTVQQALIDADGAATAVVDAVTAAGVAVADVSTLGLSVHPQYGEHGPSGAPIVGFTAAHTVTVAVRDLDAAPRVLGDAAAAGGDATRIRDVTLSVSDEAGPAAAARDTAFADARRRATQYAQLADGRLGAVVSVTETVPNGDRPVFAMAAKASPGVAVHAGSTTITASVAVTFELI